MVLPSDLGKATEKRVYEIAAKIAKALEISGPFNIQYLYKNDNLKVIKMLRAQKVSLQINVAHHTHIIPEDMYKLRRSSVDFRVPLITNLQVAEHMADALAKFAPQGKMDFANGPMKWLPHSFYMGQRLAQEQRKK